MRNDRARSTIKADAGGLHVCRHDRSAGRHAMRLTRIEKRFVNDIGHRRGVAANAVRPAIRVRSVHIVATSKMTHHVARWSWALAEMRRVLKPQGYLVYADLKAPLWLAWVAKPLVPHAGVFTGADFDCRLWLC
jgi:ubiquinone/menaquinone biosynthesis C-methylase UbiE